MQKYLKIADKYILVNYYEGFREKATITIPTNEAQIMDFWDIVKLLEANDLSELNFYYKEDTPPQPQEDPEVTPIEEEYKYDGKLSGYSKLSTTVDNREALLGTITLLKPNVNNMSLEEVIDYTSKSISESPAVAQYSRAISVMSLSMTDEQVLTFADVIAEWSANAVKYVEYQVVRYKGNLYRVNKGQGHTSQENWNPADAASLWTMINKENEGTLEDPIPVPEPFTSMEYVKGKYYIENDVLYLMNRDGMDEGEAITLTYKPSELVGQYFKVVE